MLRNNPSEVRLGLGGISKKEETQTTGSDMRDEGAMLNVQDVWLLSLLFFFALGTSVTSSGKCLFLDFPRLNCRIGH